MTPNRPSRRLRTRLFLTCWLVFVVHFATDIVREHYLSFSLAEDYSFRMDKYLGLHPDVFATPGHGAHIGNNPGVSMLGAIPYWMTRPLIERVSAAVNARERASGAPVTAIYKESRPNRIEFYRKVRERGLDVQFGLAAAVIQAFFMAPLSAFAAVALLWGLMAAGISRPRALLFAFLYALGTPIFFRTAFLNQNLLIAHLVLFGFLLLWQPGGWPAWRPAIRYALAGLCGGVSLLSDYSGAVALGLLGLFAVWKGFAQARRAGAVQAALACGVGAAGPVLLLLFYQWASFGSPWYPGQHYMPPVQWIDIGYQGVGGPSWYLFQMLLFDLRFGLFVACPLLLLGVVGLYKALRGGTWLPRPEALFLGAFTLALLVFFSAVQYTQLQWVTGIRYIVPVIPALFIPAAVALDRLNTAWLYPIAVLAFAEAWCMSMVRATYVHDSVLQVLLGGFQLPWMNVLVKMAPQYFPFMAERASPLPLLVLCGLLVLGLWRYPREDSE